VSLTSVVTTAFRFCSVARKLARAASVVRRNRPQTSTSKERRLRKTLPNVRSGLTAGGSGIEPLLELRRFVMLVVAVTVGN